MMQPLAVRNVRGEGHLLLTWADGQQPLAYARLRAACPCAQCRAARLQGRIDLVAAEVRLVEINLQGYGVQLVFDDGHQQGIYPWIYLRELG
ncbi:DUF971 domain-containing protein [Pseudomonas gingeri]|nr:gamma-butyrobetaine hydroxylase-like domain-containing protein [Pseudomonas gingeri]NWA02450.1 DUF971 domain-containing protein [Pseudomonas gingeri]NWA12377.1 DUF971 domain-containing protein [Pseudomonas gingeri]NWA57217.1 DUF971 domain-containing protein [Pseudomonas gingeri]NWA93560.1 DUF971 domain-containing protein [Pseudomonas gingeri]NWB03032.1 DUF971 domain-containing protein [Pseudomonas gingeri]